MANSIFSAAVVDDDPIQVEILRGIGEIAGLGDTVALTAFRSLGDFLSGAGRSTFDLVFLDRRLPDSEGFTAALATLAQARLACPVVLMSAHAGKDIVRPYGLTLVGPVDKLELTQPEYLKRLVEQAKNPALQRNG